MKKLIFIYLFPLFSFAGNLDQLLNLAEQNKKVEASRYTLEATKEKEIKEASVYTVTVCKMLKC